VLQRKTITSIQFVCEHDPAIDHNECNYREYIEAGYDLSKLKQKIGEQWTVFVLAPLTRRQKTGRETAVNERQRKEMTIQFGLRNVSNYLVDGVELATPERRDIGTVGWLVTDKWMDKADFTNDELDELTAAIDDIGELTIPLSGVSGAEPTLDE